MNQQTLKKEYQFKGKSLHTGADATVCLKPADPDTGIRFLRTDLGLEIPALASRVTSTARSTQLGEGKAVVGTVEHIMSALTGLGVDNAVVEISGQEMPILNGSASLYVDAILSDGLLVQEARRKYIDIREPIFIENENGSRIEITPADKPSIDIEIDFSSKVLGVQSAHWDESVDYASEIAPCRTFCFLHELEQLVALGLVKGGDVDNAIVVVEHPLSGERADKICKLFDIDGIRPDEVGYLNNLKLYFHNECGRHKLLDIIGDMRLAGGYVNAHVKAYKPGHSINTRAALAVLENKI